MSLSASVSKSRISSLIEPQKASLIPTFSSSNLGHRMPGVSRSCIPFERVSHCFPLVTPGLSPVFALFFPVRRLIKDDFPTLGTPTIISLRFFLRTLSLLISSSILDIKFRSSLIPTPCIESRVITLLPSLLSFSIQRLFSLPSDRSLLFRIIILCLPAVSSSITGFLLEIGILASITSITMSTSLRLLAISSLVFFICPGYQFMFCNDILNLFQFQRNYATISKKDTHADVLCDRYYLVLILAALPVLPRM